MKDNRDPHHVGYKLLVVLRPHLPEMQLSKIADLAELHAANWSGDGFMSSNPAEHHSKTPQQEDLQ